MKINRNILILTFIMIEIIVSALIMRDAMTVNSFILKEYDKVAIPRAFQRQYHDTLRQICEIEEIKKRLERLEE